MIDRGSNPTVVGTKHGTRSNFPTDVLVVGLYALFAPAADVALSGSISRLILLGPMLLFVPGYALVLALFPMSPESSGVASSHFPSSMTVDGAERAALSVGSSVALLPLVGFAMSVTFGEVTGPLIPILSMFTLLVLLAGVIRRRSLPEHRRFVVPLGRWGKKASDGIFDRPKSTALLNVLLGVCVVATIAALSFGLAAPQSGTTTTNVMVGTGSGDDFEMSGYATPENGSEDIEHTLLIENDEGEQIDYTVVVQHQRVVDGSVVESSEVDRFGVTVDDGDHAFQTHTADPPLDGDSLRLAYLVYVEDPPSDPDMNSAYRTTYVWTDSAEPANS